MKYTTGIRKIFTACAMDMNLNRACELATMAGFKALSYNGTIYIQSMTTKIWNETVFRIDDFEC